MVKIYVVMSYEGRYDESSGVDLVKAFFVKKQAQAYIDQIDVEPKAAFDTFMISANNYVETKMK